MIGSTLTPAVRHRHWSRHEEWRMSDIGTMPERQEQVRTSQVGEPARMGEFVGPAELGRGPSAILRIFSPLLDARRFLFTRSSEQPENVDTQRYHVIRKDHLDQG